MAFFGIEFLCIVMHKYSKGNVLGFGFFWLFLVIYDSVLRVTLVKLSTIGYFLQVFTVIFYNRLRFIALCMRFFIITCFLRMCSVYFLSYGMTKK